MNLKQKTYHNTTKKSTLGIVYCTDTYPEDYIPTVFDNFVKKEMINKKEVTAQIWDSSNQEDFGNLRPLSYPQTDVFFIIFSVVDGNSFEQVKSKWKAGKFIE